MRVIGVCVLVLLASKVSAMADIRLICENPRHEYLIVYRPEAEVLLLNPDSERTTYPILVDDNDDRSHIVTAATPNGGPTARLHLRPYLKVEFWSGGTVIQTDGCYRKD